MNALEQETVVNASNGDDLVRILTGQRRYLGRLRKDSRFTEVRSFTEDGNEWAEFTIPASQWTPFGGARYSRTVNPEAAKAAIERLAAARASRQS